MSTRREIFLKHVGQTSTFPLMLEVEKAEGIYIYDTSGKKYMDLVSGISVNSLGHAHPVIMEAIRNQLNKYMHTTVYGEHIQSPQNEFAELLTKVLNNRMNNVFFLNSGSEVVDLAMKLARKYTGRYEIIACRNAYHGSTMGAGSLRSDEAYTLPYSPFVPGIRHIDYNSFYDLDKITEDTACVIMEAVQAESGVLSPAAGYLEAVRKRCNELGVLLIFDEIQTGFGRTGYLFAFQKYGVEPDVMLLSKAMGGGLPIGAAVASKEIMACLAENPALGYITTYGGNPVCAAAALAVLRLITTENYVFKVAEKETYLKSRMIHPLIKEFRSNGLMCAASLISPKLLIPVIDAAREKGILIDFFLFNNDSIRIAPPLTIEISELKVACDKLLEALDEVNAMQA
jgi:acetylornithine/succinyldiaminopimelate/putrescine aminotransferase